MRIIRQSAFVAVPWKNGGGVTREALREPASGESFRWRVSLARIGASGPFSDFAAHERFMVLLEGRGVTLTFSSPQGPAGRVTRRELRARGDWVQFDGGLATYCDLVDGPCVDLNLMVSKTMPAPVVSVATVGAPFRASLTSVESMLVFPLDAALELQSAAGTGVLDPWDLALLSGGEDHDATIAPLRRVSTGEPVGAAQVVLATLAAA
jgi:hypothetical protein